MKRWSVLIPIVLLFLSGCEKYYVSVRNVLVTPSYLASSAVHTPDPRQKNPPIGQKLVVDWEIPGELLDENPRVILDIIYKNHSTQEAIYPLTQKRGYKVFDLLNQKFWETEGFLSYRAKLVVGENLVYREWRHQLWVNLITPEELEVSSEESNSSLSSHPKHESVSDTPRLKAGEED